MVVDMPTSRFQLKIIRYTISKLSIQLLNFRVNVRNNKSKEKIAIGESNQLVFYTSIPIKEYMWLKGCFVDSFFYKVIIEKKN